MRSCYYSLNYGVVVDPAFTKILGQVCEVRFSLQFRIFFWFLEFVILIVVHFVAGSLLHVFAHCFARHLWVNAVP